MAKVQGRFRSTCEYAGAMAGYFLLAWLPLPVSKAIATVLADVWRIADKRHRMLAVSQTMDRLDIGRPEAERLVKANYRHYGLAFLEVARLKRMSLSEIRSRTDINGCDAVLKDALAEGNGLIVLTGHLGNWEWGAVTLGMLDVVEGLIARPLDNPYLDRFIRDIRQRTGAVVWDKFGSMRKALAAVRGGKGFVAVIDQDGGRKGSMAPFLGKDGSTMASPIEMAIRTGAPLFVGAMVRTGGACTFTMIGKRVHRPRPDADAEEEKTRLLTEINEDLSEIIRDYPEQWIWIHRRWKTTITKIIPKNSRSRRVRR